MQREDVTRITVVEIAPDVIALMRDTLPDDPRITLLREDFYHYVGRWPPGTQPFDAIFWDLAVGPGEDPTTHNLLLTGFALTTILAPRIPLWQFGVRGQNLFTPFREESEER